MVRKKPPLTLVPSPLTGPPPARALGTSGQLLWDEITAAYNIDDAGGIAMLLQICAAKDSLEACMAQIETDGLMVHTKNGPKAHPLLATELALRSFICRGLTRLGLNVETIKPVGRPPGSWTGRG